MKISVHTKISDLVDVHSALSKIGLITTVETNVTYENALNDAQNAEIIFTNPNNLGFFYSREFIDQCQSLRYFVTASTGLDHVDITALRDRNVQLICLRHDADFMSKVTATAEHALCLTFAGLRKLPAAFENIKQKSWSWENCVGRQLSNLTVGVLGYGRLGKIYSNAMRQLSNELLVHDPFIDQALIPQNERASFLQIANCDVISIHVHLADDTKNLIDPSLLSRCKSDVLIVNTSRGGIVDETAMADFLSENPEAIYATDVLADELSCISENILLSSPHQSQVIITPHIGGMTKESRALAYGRAVQLLQGKMQQS